MDIKELTNNKFETVEELFDAYKKVSKENNKRYEEIRELNKKVKEAANTSENQDIKVEDTEEYKALLEKYETLKQQSEPKPEKKQSKSSDNYNITAHKYKKGDTIWIPYFGRDDQTKLYGKIQEEYKCIPTETTVRDVIIADDIKYRIAKYGGCFDEDMVCDNREDCIKLCSELNKRG